MVQERSCFCGIAGEYGCRGINRNCNRTLALNCMAADKIDTAVYRTAV